jgi:hypothetical protein
MTINGAGQFTSVSTSSQNGAVPYQISPLGAGFGLDINGTVPSTGLELSIAITRNSINKTGQIFTHPSLTSSRFYWAMYDLTPQAESMYLSKTPTKTMLYEDFLSFQTLGIPHNGNFNQVITNSIARGRNWWVSPLSLELLTLQEQREQSQPLLLRSPVPPALLPNPLY